MSEETDKAATKITLGCAWLVVCFGLITIAVLVPVVVWIWRWALR